MKLEAKAGEFNVTAFTDGVPVWTSIEYGEETLVRLHHEELSDLLFAVEKVRKLILHNTKGLCV